MIILRDVIPISQMIMMKHLNNLRVIALTKIKNKNSNKLKMGFKSKVSITQIHSMINKIYKRKQMKLNKLKCQKQILWIK